MQTSTNIASLLSLLVLHAGCSGEAPPSSGAGGGAASSSTTATTAASTSTSTGSGAATCEDGPVVPGSHEDLFVERVEAIVLDTDGSPVANELAQICGLDKCINTQTGSDGHILAMPMTTIRQPAFKFGDATIHAKLARPLPGSIATFGTVVTPKLPPLEQGAPLDPGADATSGEVTLSIPEDAVIEVELDVLDDPNAQHFRAAPIPKEMMDPEVVDQDPGLKEFFALTPLEARICPAAKLTLPNTEGFPAGAEVEVFVLGLDVGERWATYGSWTHVSDGRVSEDGATISTNDDGGLPVLSAVGVRLK